VGDIKMSVYHKCEHCNRTLTDMDSMSVGYGPVCYKKLFGVTLKRTQTNKTKTMHKTTKRMKDLSEMENLDEVFIDV
jgi:ribosomal protein L37AE/L43A